MGTSRSARRFEAATAGLAWAALVTLLFAAMAHGETAAPVPEPYLLRPNYPAGKTCSPITSLFSSWNDVDGTKRDEPHSGIDAGRLGDPILAPAPGTVIAVWRADWGWGDEGALMIRHDRAELGLESGLDFYYSEFDHLRYGDLRSLKVGQRVNRGKRLAKVFRPGGDDSYLPEVHWEVWSIADDSATHWETNEYGRRYWRNPTGHLVDPVFMMSLNAPPKGDNSVDIVPFEKGKDYRGFRGFTYILPCIDKKKPRARRR